MEDQVKAVQEVLERYMEGTYTADVPMLKDVFHQQARMSGYLGGQLLVGTPDPFLEDIGSQPSMKSLGHPYHGEIRDLEVTGNVAKATVHETGFRGSAELVDYFHLLYSDGAWKIIAKTFTTIG